MKARLFKFLRWLASQVLKAVYGYKGFYVACDYSQGNITHFDVYADAIEFFNASCEDCQMYASLYAKRHYKEDKRLLHLQW